MEVPITATVWVVEWPYRMLVRKPRPQQNQMQRGSYNACQNSLIQIMPDTALNEAIDVFGTVGFVVDWGSEA